MPMPRAFVGTYSPDGRRFAYEEISHRVHTRLVRDERVAPLPRRPNARRSASWISPTIRRGEAAVEGQQRHDPMWVGNTVYFLSDRNFTTICSRTRRTRRQLKQLTHHDDADIMNASATADAIVYEQSGLPPSVRHEERDRTRQLAIDVVGDFPWARPQFKRVGGHDSRRVALAHRRARGVRSARRHLHGAGRQGRLAQPHEDAGRARSQSRSGRPTATQLAWLSDAERRSTNS